jgi:hypothetical protein
LCHPALSRVALNDSGALLRRPGPEVVDGLVGAFGVVPVHPFQGDGFDLVQVSPGPFSLDELGLVQADGNLGQDAMGR